MTWQWWSRNEDGFWCNVCGELLRAPHQFGNDDECEEYEASLDDGNCLNCGAPDEIDPEAI